MQISLREELEAARAHTDQLFGLIDERTLYERPIPDRHRLIFYVGHFDAFDWNQLARGALDVPSFNETFDRLFEAGIDPEPGRAPADTPSDWPRREVVRDYVARARAEIDRLWDQLPVDRRLVAIEHRWMHAETLVYLLHQLDPSLKHRPPGVSTNRRAPQRSANKGGWIDIAGGTTTLGQSPGEFGWDNEFPRHGVEVAPFSIARHKVTNGDYLAFVREGGSPSFFWRRDADRWRLRRMFDEIELPLEAPVYLTHDQAVEFARWSGARLPTEGEWQRAAHGNDERRYPWGGAAPSEAHGNFDFFDWDPQPVAAHPAGATPDGVEQMFGNGWEWTSTPFAGWPGFEARPYYPGYSANFFDGQHFVLKGASPRTARRLLRASFRNWFRREYPYAYTTARLAR